MKLKMSTILTLMVEIPDILITNNPGGKEAVRKEIGEKFESEMTEKYGKEVMVIAEIVE